MSRARRRKPIGYWVERLKISTLPRNANIIELSGGTLQKVVLAKTLVQDPSIIIIDRAGVGRPIEARNAA